MSPFDYIRRRLTKIADVVLSVDGAYPTWSYSDLCMLLDEVEKEWSKECHEDGDTVSRQAAIDALRKLSREDGYIDMPHEYVTDAVRALPSAQPDLQLTCNQLATDCISRQAAIEALSHMMDTDGFRDGWAVSRANVDCMLRSLPSAQPEKRTEERTETHACDCISRRAAIDAVAEGLKRTFVEYRDTAEKMLNKVPSAQPERKMCNLCKYYEGVHHVQGHAPCSFWKIGGVMYDDYCSRWEEFERWEK